MIKSPKTLKMCGLSNVMRGGCKEGKEERIEIEGAKRGPTGSVQGKGSSKSDVCIDI